jgi:hypothetical protein
MGFEMVQVDQGSTNGFSGYHNPEQLMSEFKALQNKYPKQAKVVDLTKMLNTPKTVEGRSLYAIKISDNVDVDESEPNVLLVSNHHARELITPELALHFAKQLLSGYHAAKKWESKELGETEMSKAEIKEAKENKKYVDDNQNYMQPGTMLTSMYKLVGDAAYDSYEAAMNGTWDPAMRVLGLAENGVGYAMDEHNADLVSAEMIAAVEAARDAIIAGDIVVHDYTSDNTCPI